MTNRSQNKNLTTTLLLIFVFALLAPVSYAFTIVETTETMGAMETLQGGSQNSQRPRREPRSRSRDADAAAKTKANTSVSSELESSLKKINNEFEKVRSFISQPNWIQNAKEQTNTRKVK